MKNLLSPPTAEEQKKIHEEFINFLHKNPNNFSYWYPHVKELDNHGISVPRSIVIDIPEETYKAFFMERAGDKKIIDSWVIDHVMPSINNTDWLKNKKIFIKNGCFSNKFNFSKGCLIADSSDKETLVQHICNIQYDSLFHDTYGYLELVLREYIEPENTDTPTIYHGMPLRPEVRIFYNFNAHKLLYAVNYWDWNYCHDAICSLFGEEKTEDAITYETNYPSLEADVKRLLLKHQSVIEKALETVETLKMPENAPNIWSVDFILEENRVWLIDMAQGWRSAYWNKERAGV